VRCSCVVELGSCMDMYGSFADFYGKAQSDTDTGADTGGGDDEVLLCDYIGFFYKCV